MNEGPNLHPSQKPIYIKVKALSPSMLATTNQPEVQIPSQSTLKKKGNMSLVTDDIRAKATIHHDKEKIKEQSHKLLREVGLPNGILPLYDDAYECGYVEETGFVWIRQKKKTEHRFEKIGKLASYETEVTAYAVPTKIKNITGVKVKELFMWVKLAEITVPHMYADKVTFKCSAGPSRTYPAEAFTTKGVQRVDEGKDAMKVEEKEMKEV